MKPSSLTPVPIPDRVAVMIGSCMPVHILQAEVAAECAKREALLYRPLDSAEDRHDREVALSHLARANKVLAAYNPGLIATTKRGAR